MNYLIIIGFVLLIATTIIARQITENANKYLDHDQKAGLVDLFSDLRKKSPVFILILVILFLANMVLKIVPGEKALFGYFMILIGYQIYMVQQTYAIFKDNNYPIEYVRAQLISSSLRMIGIMILMAIFLFF